MTKKQKLIKKHNPNFNAGNLYDIKTYTTRIEHLYIITAKQHKTSNFIYGEGYSIENAIKNMEKVCDMRSEKQMFEDYKKYINQNFFELTK